MREEYKLNWAARTGYGCTQLASYKIIEMVEARVEAGQTETTPHLIHIIIADSAVGIIPVSSCFEDTWLTHAV